MSYWWGLEQLNPNLFYSIAFIVYLGVVTSLLALDGRHLLRLHGRIHSATLS